MKLKTVLGDINFKIPTGNNFYNSSGWFLMTKEYLLKYMRLYYGNREVLEGFLDPSGQLTAQGVTDMVDTLDLTFMANTWKYDHLYTLYAAKYNPIWNYEGSEERHRERDYTDDHTGTDTDTDSGTDTTEYKGSEKDTNSGGVQNAKTTYDSDTDYDTEKSTDTRSTERTFTNRKDELTHGKSTETEYDSTHTIHEEETEKMTRGGNMGTMSTQTMMEQELEIAGKLDLINRIVLDCVQAICYS